MSGKAAHLIVGAISALLLFAPLSARSETVRVTLKGVSDGDTIRVIYQGKTRRVRLLGLDAPESRHVEKLYRDASRSGISSSVLLAEGLDASAHLKELLDGERAVELEFEHVRFDRFDRLLAYVYRSDGEMMNERMLLDGYARAAIYGDMTLYNDRLYEAYRIARRKHLGIWSLLGESVPFSARPW
jgi:micrococcal nuclease